jgi:hypothetical protein
VSGLSKSRISKVAAVVVGRQARLVTIVTLGIGLVAIQSHHHKGIVSALGFALIVMSFPARGYAIYLWTRHGRASREKTTIG